MVYTFKNFMLWEKEFVQKRKQAVTTHPNVGAKPMHPSTNSLCSTVYIITKPTIYEI